MANETEIRPALTPEEWADIRAHGLPNCCVANDFYSEVAQLAMANYALPDADPRKITRTDVEWLRKLLYDRGWEDGKPGEDEPEWDQQRDALAAKLAALLPPEGH